MSDPDAVLLRVHSDGALEEEGTFATLQAAMSHAEARVPVGEWLWLGDAYLSKSGCWRIELEK